MKYALGNMLNGAGGLNADGLALDLQFAADKTLTARKGPTPVLTRGSTGTFVGSNGLIQSAGNNIARFDHDPVTLASRGLLIEEGRTNLLVQSENFGTTWTSVNLNLTGTPPYLNVATAPDGATTADKLIATTTNATHQFRQDVTLVSGTSYTFSVYYKAAETNFATISVVGVANGSADWVAYFNISASSPAAGQFNGFASTSLVDVGNGWRRCSVTFTATASGSLQARFGGATSANLNSNFYTGDGTSGFLLWGAQVEAGSFATSYIPTTTSALARSADVCSITGTNFTGIYNQPEGTLFADVTPQTVDQISLVIGFNTATFNSGNFIYKGSSPSISGAGKRWAGQTTLFTVAQSAIVSGSDIAVSRGKLTYAYKLNDMAFAANGTLIGTDNTGTMPTSTAMRIGSRDDGLAINGHLAAVRYYKKRLDNAKLQALTA